MNIGESYADCSVLCVAVNPQEDNACLKRAVQQIRWLPGVLAAENDGGNLQIVFREPQDGLLKQIHHALAAGCPDDRAFSEL